MEDVNYNFKDRKSKIEEILDGTGNIVTKEKFPSDDNFTYTNGYKAKATAIFVDLRKSTELISQNNERDIAKVFRGFTSEIIEILKKDIIEIGIRGDCVYAIYSTPDKDDIFNILDRAFYINTYMNMLNKMLEKRKLPAIKAGIGVSTAETLAVKAGRRNSNINNLIWIGDSVTIASHLANIGNKDDNSTIVISESVYDCTINKLGNRNPSKDVKSWWKKNDNGKYGPYYHGSIVKKEFSDWIDAGMKD